MDNLKEKFFTIALKFKKNKFEKITDEEMNFLNDFLKPIKPFEKNKDAYQKIMTILFNEYQEIFNFISKNIEKYNKLEFLKNFNIERFYKEIGYLKDIKTNCKINKTQDIEIKSSNIESINKICDIYNITKITNISHKTLDCLENLERAVKRKVKETMPDKYKEFINLISEKNGNKMIYNDLLINAINNIELQKYPKVKLLYISMCLKSQQTNKRTIYFRSYDFEQEIDSGNFSKYIKQLVEMGYISKTNKKFTYKINEIGEN